MDSSLECREFPGRIVPENYRPGPTGDAAASGIQHRINQFRAGLLMQLADYES